MAVRKTRPCPNILLDGYPARRVQLSFFQSEHFLLLPIVTKSPLKVKEGSQSLLSAEMQIPLAYVTLIVVYYILRVSCGYQCFTIDQIQVFNDSMANHVPCDSAASISNCCPEGWICLSNGLCEPSGTSNPNHGLSSLYTGYCTDPFWSNGTVCPKICNNNATRKNLLGH